MIPYVSTKDMTRDQWLAERRTGIGGSDAAAIMGRSKWASPLSVYLDKIGQSADKPITEAMRQGNDFEDIVAKRFSEKTGLKVQRCKKMFRHPDYPWMLANIDRQVMGGDFTGLECKTTNLYNTSDFESGEIPEEYFWQCQHYMAVTGADKWYLAVLVLSKAFYTFTVQRSDDHINPMIEAEQTFWCEHVVPRVAPMPIGTEADDEAISIIAADPHDSIVDMPDMISTFETLKLLKDERSAIDKRVSECEQIIKMRMANITGASCGRWTATYKPQTSFRIDSKAIKSDLPDIYRAYAKPSTTRILRIKEA